MDLFQAEISSVQDRSTMTFGNVVEAFEGKLTDADRALTSWLLNNTAEAVYLPSAELAAKADVHASTVVRLARKLGYDGYPAMREHIRTDARERSHAIGTQQEKLERIETGSNLSALIESEIAALAAVANTVTQSQIDSAARFLADADTIHIVGRGSAAPLTAHLDRRLRRSGFRTEVALNMQWRDLAEHAVSLRAGDVLVVFAFQGSTSLPAGYAPLTEHTNRVGAKSVVIADTTGPALRPRPDVLLSVSRPDEGSMQLRSGPMLVVEALAMSVAHLNPKRALEGLEALENLRAGNPADGPGQ